MYSYLKNDDLLRRCFYLDLVKSDPVYQCLALLMNRKLLSPVLRYFPASLGPAAFGVGYDLVSASALPKEGDLDLDDLAHPIAERFMSSRRHMPDVAATGG